MERTFGFELEFADADKRLITLPNGYRYTDNELTRMHNSNGNQVTHSGNFGGEINTRPLLNNKKDLKELEEFIESIRLAGGYLIWNEGFDAHLYAGDLSIDEIKKVFELSYWIAPHLKKIFALAPWFENKYVSPSPTWESVEKMNKITEISDIKNVFGNSSHRGHIRYVINIMPLLKIGTVEFRLFNSSWKFEEIKETIKFMYSYINYAMNNDPEDFKKLNSAEKVVKALKINLKNIPQAPKPLLWASSHDNFKTLVEEAGPKSGSILKKISQISSEHEHAKVINSYYGDIEQVIDCKNIDIYVKNLFMETYWKIIIDDFCFDLIGDYEWMEISKGDKAERLAKLMLFKNIRIANKEDAYHQKIYNDYVSNYLKYVEKYKVKAGTVIDAFAGKKLRLFVGDISDAMLGYNNELIIFQSEFSAKVRAASNGLSRETGLTIDNIETDYTNISLEDKNYIVYSKNKFLQLEKNYRSQRDYVYSNSAIIKRSTFKDRALATTSYILIPNDHEITHNSKINFIRATGKEIDYLRVKYMKVGIMLGSAPYNYLWFIDGFLIGASMFDYVKTPATGKFKVYMKSDFVIESEVWRLSKLLLMGTLLDNFRDELNARFRTNVDVIQTTIFSDKPVSMKYRGAYKKVDHSSGKLTYEQEAGSMTEKQIFAKYLKSKK